MAGILSIKIRADATPFERSLKTIGRNITAFSQKSLAIGRGISLGFTAPLMAVGATAVNAAADFDSLERALSGIMGGAGAAAGEMMKLKEAAKLPGLGFEEAVRGSVNLQAVGLSAEDARKTLIGFGTAIAASGGGAVNLASVTKQLTQMISKNRILQEDFGILQENVPLIGDALEKAFGTRNIEKVRETGIAAADFNMKLVASLQTLPAVIAATGGLRNNIDNFKDSLKFTQVELGKAILKNIDLESALESISKVIEDMLNWWGSLSDSMQSNMINGAKYIAIAGGLLWIVGQLGSAIGTITMMFGQLTAVMFKLNKATGTYQVLAGGWVTMALAAAAAIGYFAYSVIQANKPIDDLSGHLSSSAKAMRKEITELELNFKLIKDSNISNNLRLKLLTDIKNKYGQYLPDLKTEQDYLNNMTRVMTVLNTELTKKFDIMRLQGVADKQLQRSIDLLDKEKEKTLEIERLRKNGAKKGGFNIFEAIGSASNTQNIKSLYKEVEKIQKESVVIEEAWKKTSEELRKLIGDAPDLSKVLSGNNTFSAGADKTKTKFEQLQETLKNLEKRYEDQVLLYGENSKGAETLATKIRSIKIELQGVISALQKLEKIDSWTDFKPLPTGADAANEQQQNAINDEANRRETVATFSPIIQDKLVGGDLGDFLEQNRLSEGERAIDKLRQKLSDPKPTENIKKLRESFFQLGEAIDTVGEALSINLGNALADSFVALGTALANGENAALAFGKTFVNVMLDAVNSALQLLLVKNVTAALDGTKGNPLGTILAVGLGIAAISFLKSKMDTVKLAQGGLAFGPTLATVGDNRGASYDPEVIAPLSKLKSMLGDVGGGNPYVLTTRVAGSDLLVIMEKARNINTRIR
jgi:tape measure domain-containing protein